MMMGKTKYLPKK
jgi:hypothetical protein